MTVGVSKIPEEQARKLANETLTPPGTKEYLIELDIFHQLHCLNDLRKAFYPDRYPGKWKYKDGKVDYYSLTFMHWGTSAPCMRILFLQITDIHT